MDAADSALLCEILNSSVGLVSEWPGFECRQVQEIFPSSSTSRPGEGPLSFLLNSYQGFFSPAVKRPEREAKVTHEWSCTQIPSYTLTAWTGTRTDVPFVTPEVWVAQLVLCLCCRPEYSTVQYSTVQYSTVWVQFPAVISNLSRPKRPDRLWDPFSTLPKAHREISSRSKSCRCVKLMWKLRKTECTFTTRPQCSLWAAVPMWATVPVLIVGCSASARCGLHCQSTRF
jgi:hypothetical protein